MGYVHDLGRRFCAGHGDWGTSWPCGRVLFATYFIYVKKALVSSSPFITAFYSMSFGCVFLTIVTLLFFRSRVYYQLDARTILLILGVAFVSTTLGGTLNIMGLQRMEAGEAGCWG